jgi:hypothetical protein
MWKEVVAALCEMLSQHLYRVTEIYNEKLPFG